uniref:Uncharacterized protein n=1 Tax=Romanomermis culicivorax TaxID=13658 RepID=A0A915JLM3_ROMCU
NSHNQYANSLELGGNYHHRTALVNGGNYPSNSNNNNNSHSDTTSTTTSAIIWYEIHTRHPGDDLRTSNIMNERSTRDYTNYYGSSSKHTANRAQLNFSWRDVFFVLLCVIVSSLLGENPVYNEDLPF